MKEKITVRIEKELSDFVKDYARAYKMSASQALEIMILSAKGKGKVLAKDKYIQFLMASAKAIATAYLNLINRADKLSDKIAACPPRLDADKMSDNLD